MNSIPNLDYNLLSTNRPLFLKQLRNATTTIGFFTLSNALSLDLIRNIFAQCKAFFDMEVEEKMKIAMIKSPHFRGYSALGEEVTRFRIDAREQIDFGPETEAIPFEEIPTGKQFLHLYGPNLFPDSDSLPSFKQTMLKWRAACHKIASEIIIALGEATEDPNGTGNGRLKEAFGMNGVPYARSKIVRYPGVYQDAPLGVGPHKDGGGLTLLLQDDVGGLQVQKWDGQWIDIPANPDVVVVNIGQVLENLTASTLRATTHRVLIPTRTRISVPYFHSPPLLSYLKPLTVEELHPKMQRILEEREEEVSEVPSGDLHREVFGIAAWEGIIRSHDKVYQKYYVNGVTA